MMQIKLEKLRFVSGHGWHVEEAVAEGEFEVSILVFFNCPAPVSTLNDTIDYVRIYEVVRKRMENPHKLLEALAMNIADDIAEMEKGVTRIEVNINKINPPIFNFTGNVGVGYIKDIIR